MRLSILGFAEVIIRRARTTIPLSVDQNGHSFAFESSLEPAAWYLVDCDDNAYELDINYLQYNNGVVYYSGDADLFEYLSSQGYDLKSGEYFYRINVGGDVSLIISGSPTIYASDDSAYGEWKYTILNYNSPTSFDYAATLIEAGVSSKIIIYATVENKIYLVKNGTTIFKSSTELVEGNDYEIYVVRNSVTDEYITGAIGTFGVYLKNITSGGGFILLPSEIGSNPITDNSITTSTRVSFTLNGNGDIKNPNRNSISYTESDFTTEFGTPVYTKEVTGGKNYESDDFKIKTIETTTQGRAFSSAFSSAFG